MLRRLWTRKDPPDLAVSSSSGGRAPSPEAAPVIDPVDHAFRMVLWRDPSNGERGDALRALAAGQSPDDLAGRLLASTEFGLLLSALRDSRATGRDETAVSQALAQLGDDRAFVEAAYRTILGREVDPTGGASYTNQLAEGAERLAMVVSLMRSDEFADRHRALCPQAGFIPRDVQLCELANPAKWANPDWLALLSSLSVVPTDLLSMHRKGYEFGQLLFSLTQLGFVREDVEVLSVGAGHEPVLYWLANHVRRVVATDMYSGVWQARGAQEGDEGVLSDAGQFAPFPYRQDRLVFLKMDGRGLAFREGTFDVAYSLSSIEHFGGFRGARAAVADMARVLKPGGVLVLATEYCLSGPPHEEAFQPHEVHALLDHPELTLVEPIDERVWDRYEYKPIDLRVNPHQTPHMVVTDRGTVFTSVVACLCKTG